MVGTSCGAQLGILTKGPQVLSPRRGTPVSPGTKTGNAGWLADVAAWCCHAPRGDVSGSRCGLRAPWSTFSEHLTAGGLTADGGG